MSLDWSDLLLATTSWSQVSENVTDAKSDDFETVANLGLKLEEEYGLDINGNTIYKEFFNWRERKLTIDQIRETLISRRSTVESQRQLTAEEISRLRAMFVAPLATDQAVRNFYAYLLKNYQHWASSVYLAPYSALIQSSGTGKSRLVYEVGQKVFLFYICFRTGTSTGWPFATHNGSDFVSKAGSDDMIDGVVYCAYFLASCLDELATFVSNYQGDMSVIREKWRERLFVESGNTIGKEAWTSILNKAVAAFDRRVHRTANTDLEEALALTEAREFLRASYTSLANVLVSTLGKQAERHFALFAFDEASNLLPDDAKERKPFHRLRHALSMLPQSHSDLGAFAIMMDTHGQISKFLPKYLNDSSARFYSGTQLFPPFWALPFRQPTYEPFWRTDGHNQVHFNLASMNLQLARAGMLLDQGRFTHGLGRYLWNASIHRPDTDTNAFYLSIGQKLINDHPSQLSETALLAVLSPRLALQLNSATLVPENLVKSHLGMCYFVSEQQGFMIADYPSEPVVALAASLLLINEPFKGITWISTLKNLVKFIKSGAVENGYRGELLARVLLSIAWDLSVKTAHPLNPTVGDAYGPVTVRHFLTTLGSNNLVENIESCNVSKDQMAQFMNGHVFFTHFTYVTFTQDIEDLRKNFIMSSAIVCKRCEVAIDLIVPVLMPDGVMSYISIQVKNYTKDKTRPNDVMRRHLDEGRLEFGLANVPFVTLLMQVGANVQSQCVALNPRDQHSMDVDGGGALVKLGGLEGTYPFLTGKDDLQKTELLDLVSTLATCWTDAVSLIDVNHEMFPYSMQETVKTWLDRSYDWTQ